MRSIKAIVGSIASRFSGLRPPPKPTPELEIRVTSGAVLCNDPSLEPGDFCMPAERVEPLLRDGDMHILDVRKCASGVAGAQIVYCDFPQEKLTIKAKWKEAKHGGSALNNEPRKEVAAFEIQKWFLEPAEYVVPPTVCRAIPLDRYKNEVRETRATFDGTDCAFGALAFWLDGVEDMPKGFDAGRFEADLAYRDTIANMNLLTYLIDHRDTRPANFVFSKDPKRPRAFSIDNGLAFSGLVNPRVLVLHEWRHMIVPKVPRAKIDRIRALTRKELDKLGVVAQLERRERQLWSVPTGAVLADCEDGVRCEGNILQLGLRPAEVDGVEERIGRLLAEIDSGKIALY